MIIRVSLDDGVNGPLVSNENSNSLPNGISPAKPSRTLNIIRADLAKLMPRSLRRVAYEKGHLEVDGGALGHSTTLEQACGK